MCVRVCAIAVLTAGSASDGCYEGEELRPGVGWGGVWAFGGR